MEKRFFRRVNVQDGFCNLMKGDMVTGIVENISLGGLFVRTDMHMKASERMKISITLPRKPNSICIDTDVIATRVENGGVAFKYDSLDHKDFWTLQSFIHGISQ